MQRASDIKKNILIIRNAYSFDFGGGERMPVELAKQLHELGYKPLVVSRSPKLLEFAETEAVATKRGWWWSFQDWSGKRLLLFPVYLAWQLLLIFWYMILILRTHSHIVHPQSRDDFIAATVAGKLLGKPVIWTDHADLKYVYQNVSVWYKNPLGKLVYWLSNWARAVILVSENEKVHITECLKRSVPENYVVIYNGVPLAKVAPAKRPAKDKDSVIFTATSRLVTAKGIGELIEAFHTLSQERSDVRLWLFGEGPEAERFKAMAKTNEHIVFWGFPHDAMSRVADCDVFVHPSYHEGFSLSLVEAAKLGLPIIACEVGGNPELVSSGTNGLLVPPRDATALLAAMKTLADDRVVRERYGNAAHKIYKDNFVWEHIIKEKYARLYE